MSVQSNNQGRAYEFICINTLQEQINKIRKSEIIKNSAYFADERAWKSIDENLKAQLIKSSNAVVSTIFEMEPMILEKDDDVVRLAIQTDNQGKSGDVRDIVISRTNVSWEIGLSIKHNHFAVKHSRLAKNLDFAKKWFNIPCSSEYWEEIKPIFTRLEVLKSQKIKWNEVENKDKTIYVPLLTAFKNEIINANNKDSSLSKNIVEYLLGEFDFYKIISIDAKRLTQIESFNIHGTLNRSTKTVKSKIFIPVVDLPTRIVSFDFKPKSSNTLELYMDNGWQFSFRIHNAETMVVPSLKFDIQIVGMPTTIISINCLWK